MVVVLRGDAHLGRNHVALEVIFAVLLISAAVFLESMVETRMSLLGGGFQTNRAGLGALIALLASASRASQPESCGGTPFLSSKSSAQRESSSF